MKTQISNIIDGSKINNRMFSHSKYADFTLVKYVGLNAPYLGFCDLKATNHIDRMAIAKKVQEENENGMTIELLGHQYNLKKCASASGKTITFCGDISLEDFKTLTGRQQECTTFEACYYMMINADMTCDVYSMARRNERSQWKGRTSDRIDTAYITIL